MHVVELVLAIGWAAFWLYWLVAAISMKRGRVPWSRELGIRAVLVVVVILLLRLGAFRGYGLNTDPWRAGLGLARQQSANPDERGNHRAISPRLWVTPG